jgi:hypothetical protein
MPYQGESVSLEEMLEILVNNDRTEAAAALELERAIEDNRISLLLPDGTNDEGETLYCQMSPLGRSHVVAVLRSFPNRMRIPLIMGMNTPVEMIKAARALRIDFEVVCGLAARPAEVMIDPSPRQTAEQACRDLITALRSGDRLTKAIVYARARELIPDLSDKEFDSAWRATAGDWATGGRPKKTLN